MRFGNRDFAPRSWAVLVYLVVLSSMLWLGNWQLERAALKMSFQQAADQALMADAIPLSGISDFDAATANYTRVALQGIYDGTRQFLWDNRILKGQAGFEVIVPLELDGGSVVLVNRGWIAPGPSREQLPDVRLPESVIDQVVQLEGYLSRPSRGLAGGAALQTDRTWPCLLQYLDYDAIGQALGKPVIPALVQAQLLSTDGTSSSAPTVRPEWLAANWQPAASGPAKHYSYAFQWFSMAIALSILFFIINSRKIVSADAGKVSTHD